MLEASARAVDAVLDAVEFTHPVGMEDILAVRDAIRESLPAEAKLEIFHRITHAYPVVTPRRAK